MGRKTKLFKIGRYVWAKRNGYPKWPGVVCEAPAHFKKKFIPRHRCIYFFALNDYKWINIEHLKPYFPCRHKLAMASEVDCFVQACKLIQIHIKEKSPDV